MAGSHTWATNDVLTASDLNSYVRDNTIPQVTSATRPTGVQGQIIYETDTLKLQIYSGSGWVEFGGHNGWTSYTPTLTQSATVTKTVSYAKYLKIGRQVTVQMLLSVTGSGTANNTITVTTPFTAAIGSNLPVGSGFTFDTSAALNYPNVVLLNSTTTFAFIDTSAPHALFQGQTGADFAAALAVGDSINFTATYESAS